MWEIDGYCLQVPLSDKPVKEPPLHSLAWRAHLNSIVSIELAEDKGLIITASADCCVRLFTLNGRYIGIGRDRFIEHDYPDPFFEFVVEYYSMLDVNSVTLVV